VDYQHFEHPDFAIDVPADWISIPSPKFEAVFVMPPFPEGAGINLSISILKPTAPTTFEQVVSDLRTVQEAEYPGYQIHNETMVDFATQTGFAQFYTWENTGDQIAIDQSQVVFIGATGLAVGILTFTRPSHMEQADIETLDDLFYGLASSFVLRE